MSRRRDTDNGIVPHAGPPVAPGLQQTADARAHAGLRAAAAEAATAALAIPSPGTAQHVGPLAQRIDSLLPVRESPHTGEDARPTVALAACTMVHGHLAHAGPSDPCADAAGAHHGRLNTRRGRRRRGAASAAADGLPAQLASDCIEAIECLDRQTCGGVLLDVQVPETPDMRGLESSRRINERWRNVGRPVIIAMTADALRGDREECLVAGMDGHMSKPNSVDRLIALLVQARPPAPTHRSGTWNQP